MSRAPGDRSLIKVRNPRVIGRPLPELSAQLPAGVRIFAVRSGNENRVPGPDIVLGENDIVALAGESEAKCSSSRCSRRRRRSG